MDFFTTIVDAAHEGVVTTDDFEPFVGRENWLSFDRAEYRGESDCEPWVTGVIWKFRLDGIAAFADNTLVLTLFHSDNDEEVILMDADELAIRMDES